MKSIKSDQEIKSSLSVLLTQMPLMMQIASLVDKKGGRSFLVGGAVRDIVLGLKPQDIDVEIHGISIDEVEILLKNYGIVRLVGKAFGVLRIDGSDIDFSVARTDSKGRHPVVVLDKNISLIDAAIRRDLTINAMFIDLISQELQDPFNGMQDIENKILRAPCVDFFKQDPLRFYRVLQFIGRFQMFPDKALSDVCATMDVSQVSQERIFLEIEKLFLFSKKPSRAFKWLDSIGRLQEFFPELCATKGVMQNPEYHPEGDVFEHTMQALDAAAAFDYKNNQKRLLLMFAALCHDLGKVTTSRIIDGRIRSHGHDIAGVVFAEKLLNRLTGKIFFKKPVTCLVRYHMMPYYLVAQKAGSGAYKLLAYKLSPDTCMEDLAQLALFDKSARNPKKDGPLFDSVYKKELTEFIDNSKKMGIWKEPEQPILIGKDLCAHGIMPGPKIGILLQRAYDLQIEKNITNKNELKKMVLKSKK